METLNERLQSLRDNIDRAFKEDAITRKFRDKCNEITASLVVVAVSKNKHPIHVQLKALGDAITTVNLDKKYWVAPHFYSGNPQRRKHSGLQFLLLITLRAEVEWQKLIDNAGDRTIPSGEDLVCLHNCLDQMTSLSVDELSPEPWLRHLLKALDLLHDPGAMLRLDGNALIFPNGQNLQLKQGRLTLMRMLLEAPEHRVRHEDLHAEGVKKPTQVLSELRTKLLNDGLPDIDVDNANAVMHLRM